MAKMSDPNPMVDSHQAQNGIYTKIFLRYETSFWANADYVVGVRVLG